MDSKSHNAQNPIRPAIPEGGSPYPMFPDMVGSL